MLLGIEKHRANQLAVLDAEGQELTYGDLSAFVTELQSAVHQRALCFVMLDNNAGGAAWTYATMATHTLVPLLLNAKMDVDLLKGLYETYRPTYVCCPKGTICSQPAHLLMERYGYCLYQTTNAPCALYEHLSLLLPTSGSTGSPKLVRHSYDNIEASAHNIATFFELTSSTRPLLVLPLYYTMGLSVLLSHFAVGATLLITSLAMTDRKFWNFIKEQRATSFTGVPYSYEILNMMRFFRMDLPDLALLTQGGGKMSPALNLRFAEYCRDNGKQWIATYGQSEGTARMAYLPAQYAVEKCGSIGMAVPNGELSLQDEEGRAITLPHVEGELCYKGANVTLGYAYTQDDLNKGDERHGFLPTGDVAYRDEDGFYYIVGRKARFLKLFGMRVGLDECEQIIRAKWDIPCACVGTDEKMYIFTTNAQQVEDIKKELVDKTHIVASAFELRTLRELPKTDAGKINYKKLQSLI